MIVVLVCACCCSGFALVILSCLVSISLLVSVILYLSKGERWRQLKLWSMCLAHSGIAIIVFSIAINSVTQEEKDYTLKMNDLISFREFDLRLSRLYYKEVDNYGAMVAELNLTKAGELYTVMKPEVRFFKGAGGGAPQVVAESAIWSGLFFDICCIMTELDQGSIFLKVQYRPMIRMLWLGCALMVLGAVAALLSHVGRGGK